MTLNDLLKKFNPEEHGNDIIIIKSGEGWSNISASYNPDQKEIVLEMDCVTLDDVFDNARKEKTFEESVLIQLIRDMPKEMGVLYIQSFQQEHGPFTDEAADIIREYLSKE